jgi:3-hydroxyacyl-CoA dehydrogenase
VYDISDQVLGQAKERLTKLKDNYKEDLRATQQTVDEAFSRISFYADLAQAVADADLVIEAIPEVAKIKTDFYTQLGKVAPEKTIFATNSSTLLPSQFAEVTGRPDKFLALHFASGLWKNNTAEVMKHLGTNQKVFQDVIEFAKNIGMVALPLYKEQPGYILNSLLVPFLEAAQLLLMNQVADIETIDKTWMIATGAPDPRRDDFYSKYSRRRAWHPFLPIVAALVEGLRIVDKFPVQGDASVVVHAVGAEH